MIWLIAGSLFASFVVTGMLAQLFPDGRFPFPTILLVIVLGAVGAYAGNLYLRESIVTGALLGAGFVSGGVLLLFHRTGFLAQEPWGETPPGEEGEHGA